MRAVQLALGLLLAVALAGCDDDPAVTPADTGVIVDSSVGDSQVVDDSQIIDDSQVVGDSWGIDDQSWIQDSGAKPDQSSKPDANPACPPTKPSGFCDAATAPVCSYGNDTCRCTTVCSGVQPPPGQTHHWVCAPPPPAACPTSAPADGAVCSPNGLKCSYGTCAVTKAECINGKWKVTFMPPPP